MNKDHILSEIKRTAEENGGEPLGKIRFEKETGIKPYDWEIYWLNWSDLVKEAGFKPNTKTQAIPEDELLKKIIVLIRELGKFPTYKELNMKARKDTDFPSMSTFDTRLGNKDQKIKKILKFSHENEGFEDIIEICSPLLSKIKSNPLQTNLESAKNSEIGHVYLLKHDKVYCIGRSIDPTQRYNWYTKQMPYKCEEIHVIETDDPSGIEAYWHNRFRDKKLPGGEKKGTEWFELSAQDVRAFKRWRKIW